MNPKSQIHQGNEGIEDVYCGPPNRELVLNVDVLVCLGRKLPSIKLFLSMFEKTGKRETLVRVTVVNQLLIVM